MINQTKKELLCQCGNIKDRRSNKCYKCVNKLPWTNYEDNILIDNFNTTSSYEISKLIKRSHSSIRHRAVFLNLTNNKKNNSFKHKKYNKSNKGEKSHLWRGGKIKNGNYILIYNPSHPFKDKTGYVYEHRLIVEKFINRLLNQDEVVHHIDGNPKNNKLDNLMLFKNNSEHIKFHIKIKQFGMTRPIKRQIENRWNI